MATDLTEQALRAMADVPMTLSVSGKDYPICKLGPGDLAACQEFVATERKRRYMASATLNEYMLPLHAQVLAKLECEPVSIGVLPNDPAGRMRLCYIALKKGGWQGTFEDLGRELDHEANWEFFQKLCVISGIFQQTPKGETDTPSDPTEPTPDTT